MSAPAGYVSLLAAAARTGLGVDVLMDRTVVVGGESMVPISVVEQIASERNALARDEQRRYFAGEIGAEDRKY